MRHTISDTNSQKNKAIWANNLVRFQQSGSVPLRESELEGKRRMPLQMLIIGWYQILGVEIKGRKE